MDAKTSSRPCRPSRGRARTFACTVETPTRGTSAVAGRASAFDYLYSDDELLEWVEPLRELAGEAENAYVLFNNNNRSPGIPATAATSSPRRPNADRLRQILQEAELPVS